MKHDQADDAERIMKKPVVLHVLYALDFGGVESIMRMLSEHSSISSFDHRFCALSRGGGVAEILRSRGEPVYVLGEDGKIPSARTLRALYALIKAIQPDVVHARGAEANFHATLAAKMARVPVCVVEEIGLPRHSGLARFVFKKIYRLVDGIIAVAESVKGRVVELGEARPERITRIYNPAPMHEKRRGPWLEGGKVRLGFVGRLEPVKNAKALVLAMGILRSKGLEVHLSLAGDGSQRDELHTLTVSEGLSDAISFLGYVTEPFSVIGNCDVYIQPSLSEGLALAIVEAMSAGIPVVATGVGGMPEIIEDGINGWLLDGVDPESIASRIQSVINLGPDVLRDVGAKGRESVIARFTPQAYIRNLDAYYRDLLQKKSSQKRLLR